MPAPLKFGDGLKVIMYAGRLEYIKGVHVLIGALGILQHSRRDWVCAIAGSGSLTEALQEQVRELGIEDRVFFTGKIDNIPAALTAADIYVQPSLQDTQPFTVTEARLAGIAPIVAGTAGMPEMVQQGVTGFVVPPGDNAALAAQLEQLLGDDELRIRTGKQARSWAAQNRSLDGMAAGTLMAYHKAVALHQGKRGCISDRSWRKSAVSSRLPDAFHPADVLELMPGDPLALTLREGLPQNYSIPDAQMVIGE
nr:glycosyltransferase [Paenibacillus sonchi]